MLLNSILWLTLPDLQCTTPRFRCTGYATVKNLWIKSTNGGKRYHTLNPPEPSRMTSPRKEWLNVEGAKESGARSKRQTRPTQKALQSAVELKRRQILRSRKRLLSVMQSVEGLSDDSHIDTVARDLTLASEEFAGLLQELIGLYEQDSRGDYLEEAHLSEENETLNRALLLLDSLKNRITRQSTKLLETRSVCSRHSSRHSSASKTSSTTTRLQALAEA